MSFEKDYYEFERFWNNPEYSHKINIEKIKITFEYLSSGDITSILDAACGNGVFTNMAAEQFPQKKIVGFDRSEAALKYVKTEKFVGEITSIPFSENSFDCVVAHDVIEHLPVDVYELALAEIARVASKYIVIAVPFEEDLEENISECLKCKTIFNNDLHFRSFDKAAINKLFIPAGFECVSVRTCESNTFYVGQKAYGNLFYPKWKKHFRSPICPLCGYSNPDDSNPGFTMGANEDDHKRSILSLIKKIPKAIWPRYSRDYEMVAFFKKSKECR